MKQKKSLFPQTYIQILGGGVDNLFLVHTKILDQQPDMLMIIVALQTIHMLKSARVRYATLGNSPRLLLLTTISYLLLTQLQHTHRLIKALVSR